MNSFVVAGFLSHWVDVEVKLRFCCDYKVLCLSTLSAIYTFFFPLNIIKKNEFEFDKVVNWARQIWMEAFKWLANFNKLYLKTSFNFTFFFSSHVDLITWWCVHSCKWKHTKLEEFNQTFISDFKFNQWNIPWFSLHFISLNVQSFVSTQQHFHVIEYQFNIKWSMRR